MGLLFSLNLGASQLWSGTLSPWRAGAEGTHPGSRLAVTQAVNTNGWRFFSFSFKWPLGGSPLGPDSWSAAPGTPLHCDKAIRGFWVSGIRLAQGPHP